MNDSTRRPDGKVSAASLQPYSVSLNPAEFVEQFVQSVGNALGVDCCSDPMQPITVEVYEAALEHISTDDYYETPAIRPLTSDSEEIPPKQYCSIRLQKVVREWCNAKLFSLIDVRQHPFLTNNPQELGQLEDNIKKVIDDYIALGFIIEKKPPSVDEVKGLLEAQWKMMIERCGSKEQGPSRP